MQSLYIASKSPPPRIFDFPWTLPCQTPVSSKRRTSLKPLTLPNSLKTSFDYEFEKEELKLPDKTTTPASLPVIIRQSGRVLRYSWDGEDLKLVSLDGNSSSFSSSGFDFEDGFRKLFGMGGSALRNFFIPREVGGNYLEYVKWKFLHRVFSSALQVLATQAMFRAIGIGYSQSLPSAAALNWVLKDGLGRLSRCIYTASLASAFDTNLKVRPVFCVIIALTPYNFLVYTDFLSGIFHTNPFALGDKIGNCKGIHFQRVRFATSVVFSLSIGVELLTPAFPQCFLFLASIANIAKQISLACYLATGTAVHRSFAISDNLGEISAKAQIQTVCFDNLGLLLAAILNLLVRNSPRLQAGLPFVVYPIFSAVDLFGIYQGLKHVHLQTLTKDRLEIITSSWIQSGRVPSPSEVSEIEGIDIFSSKGRKPWSIRIGCLHPNRQIPKLSMLMMRSLNDEDFYFICMEISRAGPTKTGQKGILLSLREGASTADIIMGMLQACYIQSNLSLSQCSLEKHKKTCNNKDRFIKNWFTLFEDSKRSLQDDFNILHEQMVKNGWSCKNVLLSTQEQARYTYLHNRT